MELFQGLKLCKTPGTIVGTQSIIVFLLLLPFLPLLLLFLAIDLSGGNIMTKGLGGKGNGKATRSEIKIPGSEF